MNPVSDNTAAEVHPTISEDLRTAAIWVEIGAIGFATEYAAEISALEKRVLGYADALDALREAVKGTYLSPDMPIPADFGMGRMGNVRAAISQLLGSESEAGNGR